jgi:hypothetical protein
MYKQQVKLDHSNVELDTQTHNNMQGKKEETR